MKKSPLFYALAGMTMLWAVPASAQTTTTTTTTAAPAPAAGPVVINNAGGGHAEGGGSSLYPGLTWGGLTIWGLSYGAAAVAGAMASDACDANTSFCIKGRGIMYVPVVGPFAAAGAVDGRGTNTARTLLILDGAFQAGGIAMMISGLVMSAQSHRSVAALAPKRVAERKLLVTPYTTPTSAGIGAIGTF